jgi:hypothetical protein
MSVKEIESAITQLPAKDVSELMLWLEDYHSQIWEKQIEADLEAGRLDKVLDEVDADLAAGLDKPL